MRKASKQCILIFNILTVSLLLSSCMNSIYQEIESRIDSYYEEKRIYRFCSFSFIDFYKNWEAARDLYPELELFNLGLESNITKVALDNYIRTQNSENDNIELFDKITKHLSKARPDFFNQCKKLLDQNCSNQEIYNRVNCHEKNAKLFYYYEVKNSSLFSRLTKKQQSSISESIDSRTRQ